MKAKVLIFGLACLVIGLSIGLGGLIYTLATTFSPFNASIQILVIIGFVATMAGICPWWSSKND